GLYKARIQNLVGGFKNQLKMWDVVNEPVTTIPWEKALQDTVSRDGKIDDGIRYNVKGITLEETLPWVENSYKWANEADLNGDFILNEFYVIAKPEIREKFYQLIKELHKREAPVRGIGIQAHEPREMWFSPIEIVKTFDKFKELGLPLHITEFTPHLQAKQSPADGAKVFGQRKHRPNLHNSFIPLRLAILQWFPFIGGDCLTAGPGLKVEDYSIKILIPSLFIPGC
ncbi:MAG: endo-1,4-beta-xylanase, partial [Segetibacter sp.]